MGPGPTGGAMPGQAGPPWMQQNGALPAPPQNRPPAPPQPLQQSLFAPPNSGTLAGPSQALYHNAPPAPYPPSPNAYPPALRQNNAGPPQMQAPQGQVQRHWMPMPPAIQTHVDNNEDNDDGGKRPGAGVIATIVVLLVVLIGGGSFAALSILRQSGGSANNPLVPITIVTPSVTPLFKDTFQNNAAGWDLTAPTGAKIALSAGKLVLESDNHEIFPVMVPGKALGNFRLDVNVGLTQGDTTNGYGVYIRASSTQDSTLGLYYRLEVYCDGTFAVYKGIENPTGNTQVTTLKADTSSDAIYKQNRINHLTVIASGTSINFMVNGSVIYSFIDKSYKSGSIALFVSNVSGVPAGAQATFTDLAIFPAQ
jgi:hypothetical protein